MAFPTSGCVAYYKLENLNDSVGSLNLTNHGTVTFVPGKIANCANFVSASSQWLSHADATTYQFGTGDFSFSFWFNTTSANNFMQTINYGGRGPAFSGCFYLEVSGGTLRGLIQDASNNSINLDNFINADDGNWHFVVVSVTRIGNLVFYVDNSIITNTLALPILGGSMNSSSLGLGFGGDAVGANLYDGKIDEMGMWNRALSGTEASDLWNSGTGLTFPVSTQSQRRTLSALGTRIGSRQLQEV